MANYDISRFIDTVTYVTRQPNLIYIGHSMGTTLCYILLATQPQYNHKIKLFINLSPIVYFQNNFSKVINFIRNVAGTLLVNIFIKSYHRPKIYSFHSKKLFQGWVFKYQVYELFPQNRLYLLVERFICRHRLFNPICRTFLSYFGNVQYLNNVSPYF